MSSFSQRNLKLYKPPHLKQNKDGKYQFSQEDALSTARIAKARVHVERVIQRFREYDLISGKIPWVLTPYIDDMLCIVAGLTNLGPPVMNIDKFM